jgi:hypothetical protein
MMFYLTILEFIISIYWFVNSLLFKDMKSLLDPTFKKCKQCLFSSLFALFFQNLDFMFFIFTLYNLLKFFEDPAHEKSGFSNKRKYYFIVSIIASFIYSYSVFLGELNGLSVINFNFYLNLFKFFDIFYKYILYFLAYVNLLR